MPDAWRCSTTYVTNWRPQASTRGLTLRRRSRSSQSRPARATIPARLRIDFRQPAPVEPNRMQSRGLRAGDIRPPHVPDHRSLPGFEAELLERHPEDPGIRLLDPGLL